MITINPTDEIHADAIFSRLMNKKRMVPRFRLPYTPQQVFTLLREACHAEVAARHRKFIASDSFLNHIRDIAQWITSDDSSFGLFLCGGAGNGKSTILRALKSLIDYLRSNEPSPSYNFPIRGFAIVPAKHLVALAKAYNNPSRDNSELVNRYTHLRDLEILAIDDIGTEARESIHYGDFVTAVIDIMTYRYDEQLCTFASSNLAPAEIATYYDERIADRFREMMHIINFGTEQSFRKQ